MTKRELESKNSLNLSSINQENESASRVRSIVKSNGFVVYTRNKKLKSSVNNILESNGEFKVTSVDVEVTSQGGDCLHNTVITDDLSGIERYRRNDVRVRGRGRGRGRGRRSDMVEVEVKQMEIETEGEGGNVSILRRFTRSALKKSSEGEGCGGSEETGECKDVVVRDDGGGNVASGGVQKAETKGFKRVVIKGRPTTVIEGEQTGEFRGVAVRDAGGENVASGEVKKAETKVSKKIVIKGRPTTVIELFETGLLEDYPVFYHAGKKGIVLRGTVKDIGILCFCSFCMGARVIPPSQFEIHAIKIYKRASQYICMENGKSLLDIVKECSKCSLKALQGMIQTLIGPMPEKESRVCRNCKESFWATSTATMGQVCDSCMIHIRRETNAIRTWRDVNPIKATYVKQSVAIFKAPDSFPDEKSENADEPVAPSRRGRKKKKFLELVPMERSPGRSPVHVDSRMKVPLRVTERSPKPVLVPNSTGSISVNKLVRYDSPAKISHRSLNAISSPSSSINASRNVSASLGAQWKITKKDQSMHKLVFEEGGLPNGTEVAYYSHGKKLLEGFKKGGGIFCCCCSSEVSPSTFEAHAGWASRRRPYFYIYTSNGVSLHEFAISLLKGRKCTAKDNDDLCIICADGGKLVLCDGCPRAFHRECASLSSIPRGKWYCNYCRSMFQKEKDVEFNENALAAGRITGIDPIEQITNRLIRIVKNPEETEVIACAICRAYDFSKSGFGPRTVILCDQCEKEYHIGCLKKSKVADLKELPKGKWFCSTDCKRIHSTLEYLLTAGAEKLSDSCLDVIKNKHQDQLVAPPADLDVSWRLLSGKVTSRETRLLLSEAVAIFHECFDPIVDSVTGRDFIPSMVYGRNIRGQDFSGVYCVILTVNSSVVSAGILRIFGQDFAELPLVATRTSSQGKGYFRLLFSCIEKLLTVLNVRTFVLPAADEAESIWINKFGFTKIPPEQLFSYRKICWQMICFKGTSMLEKTVPRCPIIIHQDDADSEVLEQ